jgi:hypothetical protein
LPEGADAVARPGTLVWKEPHEKAAGAHRPSFAIPGGHVILTIWHGKLHELVYQTPAKDAVAAAERNAALFAHYGDGHLFNEILDNGFGKTCRRADTRLYALWSYAMDFTTVGTMEFHEVRWG